VRLALLLFAVVVALRGQPSSTEAAWDLLAKGERAQAVQLLHRIVQAEARNAEARLMLGSILAEDGKLTEALPLLESAVQLKPRSAEARQAYGEALRTSGDRGAARVQFEEAVRLDPQFSQARVDLGLMLVEAGEFDAAAPNLDSAIALMKRDPESALPRYLRAKIETQRNEFEKATVDLQEAIGLRPDFAEAWSDLGQARKMLRDDDGALAAFERSAALAPGNAVTQYRLGAEYLRRGRAHDAVLHLQAAQRLKPDDQATLYSLQMALREDGQPAEATRVKEKLAEVLRRIDEESQRAFAALGSNNEGAALEKAGDIRGAVEKYRAAVRLDPTHVGMRVNLAVALLRLGEWAEGLAELRESARRDPRNAKVQAALADALEQAPAEYGGKGKARPPR
jgi:tetratricopeptide (TPR) repeat protein